MNGSNGDTSPAPDPADFLQELAHRLEAEGVGFDPRDLVVWLAAVWGRYFTGEEAPAPGELARDYRKALDGKMAGNQR